MLAESIYSDIDPFDIFLEVAKEKQPMAFRIPKTSLLAKCTPKLRSFKNSSTLIIMNE